METLAQKIDQLAAVAERPIPESVNINLCKYSDLLLDWNTKINVISRKDTDQIFEQHIAPSLSYYMMNMITEQDERIVDIGSGGGLPGIVNAICYPDRQFTLLDATKKKVGILTDVIEKLNLANCNAIWGRAEDIAFSKGHKATYDLSTSRGVTALRLLVSLTLPFLKPDGLILAMKGGDLADEIKGIKKASRFDITEYEMDERFHYIERFQTLKLVEIARGQRE
jgi:16S rRNA (guanine527-N7)-methyltransferase